MIIIIIIIIIKCEINIRRYEEDCECIMKLISNMVRLKNPIEFTVSVYTYLRCIQCQQNVGMIDYLSTIRCVSLGTKIYGLTTKIVFFIKKIKPEQMNGSRLKDMKLTMQWHTEQAGPKFQGVSPVVKFFGDIFQRVAYSHEMLSWLRLRGINAHSVSLSGRASQLFVLIYTAW